MGNSNQFALEFYDMDFSMEDRREAQGPAGKEATGAPKEQEWGSGMQLLSPQNAEHYGITDLELDPSGRYVATSASVWRHSVSRLFLPLVNRRTDNEACRLKMASQSGTSEV